MRRDGRGERVQWQAGKAGQARAASVVCAVRNALRFRWGRQRHGARDLAAWARARALREHTPCAVFDVIKGGRVTLSTARAAVVPSADTRQPRRTPAHAAPAPARARAGPAGPPGRGVPAQTRARATREASRRQSGPGPRDRSTMCVDCGQYWNSMNRLLLLTDSGLRRDVERGVCPLYPRPRVSRRL